MLNEFQSNIDVSLPSLPPFDPISSKPNGNSTSRILLFEGEVDEKYRVLLCFTSNSKTNNDKVIVYNLLVSSKLI